MRVRQEEYGERGQKRNGRKLWSIDKMCIIDGFIGKEKMWSCVHACVCLCVCWEERGVKWKLLMNYNEQ